jgi:hypothetical protein
MTMNFGWNYKNARRKAVVTAAALLMNATSAIGQTTMAQNHVVVSPYDTPGGRTYEQWTVEWWKWAYSIPAFWNPIGPFRGSPPMALTQYPPGYDCGMEQDPHSPVFFLAGTPGNAAQRNCDIPARKMIFFPIVNIIQDYPCPDRNFKPGPGQSLEQFLTIGYRPNLDVRPLDHADTKTLQVMLDGSPLTPDLTLPLGQNPYRATSALFNFKGDPSLAAFDPCVTGSLQPGLSDGYWVMLYPLTPGTHDLRFHEGSSELIYTLKVATH